MQEQPERGIIQVLVECAPAISREVARFLGACEHLLVGGTFEKKGSRLDPESTTPERLLPLLQSHDLFPGEDLKYPRCMPPLFGRSQDTPARHMRLASLVLQAWSAIVVPRRSRRPDILAICCDLLSHPSNPYTISVARYAVVLSLRAHYDVRFTIVDVERLRRTYDRLSARFAQQTRRRVLKEADPFEDFLIDLMGLQGRVYLSLSQENLRVHYDAFSQHPFGIDPTSRRRVVGTEPARPELRGELPDLPSIINAAFGQPLCVPGLDEVMGGLIPTVPVSDLKTGGGQITLVAGPPGSGKTCLCLSLASRMAELGATVRYVTTEEDDSSLKVKLSTTGGKNYLARALWPDVPEVEESLSTDFKFVPGHPFTSLKTLGNRLYNDLAEKIDKAQEKENEQGGILFFLVFQRILVIDSITVLVQKMSGQHGPGQRTGNWEGESLRRELSEILGKLRDLGVCVFLVGGIEDLDEHGLAYLMDNVVILKVDSAREPQHPLRTLTVHKTRLQISHRGSHVLHLSRHHGCTVSPSLHAVIRSIREQSQIMGDPQRRAVLFVPDRQLMLPLGERRPGKVSALSISPLTLQAHSRVLVFGRGSCRKAVLGMALAFEPRMPVKPRAQWEAYLGKYSEHKRTLTGEEKKAFDRSRILVVSFLYGGEYYDRIARHIINKRFRARPITDEMIQLHLKVLDFYPGFIDPETVVARVRELLSSAQIEGHPFSAVLIDGIHNVLLQYPLLQDEKLLWPSLFRVLRAHGVDTISTFTFFQTGRLREPPGRDHGIFAAQNDLADDIGKTIGVTRQTFFHLLISSCDYSLEAEHVSDDQHQRRDLVHVRLNSSIEGFENRPQEFFWDPDDIVFSSCLAAPREPDTQA